MELSKEEGGASPKVTRHTLYTMGHVLGDGASINICVYQEITYVPPQTQGPVRSLEQGYGRRSDRRQTELFGPESHKRWAKAPETATASTTTQEATSWLEGLDDRPLYGSPPMQPIGSVSHPQEQAQVRSKQQESDSSPSVTSRGQPPHSSPRSSKTSRRASPQEASPVSTTPSRTSKGRRTASGGLLGKSSASRRK